MASNDRCVHRVSLTEFRQGLSRFLKQVEAGGTIEVTRRARGVVRLVQAEEASCHTGDRFGKGTIRPLLKHPGILESLWDDRGKMDGQKDHQV